MHHTLFPSPPASLWLYEYITSQTVSPKKYFECTTRHKSILFIASIHGRSQTFYYDSLSLFSDSFFISFYTKLFGGLRGALCIMFKWWKALHKTALLFIILEFLLCNNKSQFKLLRSRSRLVYSYNVCLWKSAASVKLDWRMYCFYYFSHFHGCGLCHWEFSCFSAAFYNDFLSFYTFPFDFLRDASSFSRKKNVDVQ